MSPNWSNDDGSCGGCPSGCRECVPDPVLTLNEAKALLAMVRRYKGAQEPQHRSAIRKLERIVLLGVVGRREVQEKLDAKAKAASDKVMKALSKHERDPGPQTIEQREFARSIYYVKKGGAPFQEQWEEYIGTKGRWR